MVRIYDLRSLPSATTVRNGDRPLHAFCPPHLADLARGSGSVPIPRRAYDRLSSGASDLAFSASGELLLNSRGADIYRFGRFAENTTIDGVPTCTEVTPGWDHGTGS